MEETFSPVIIDSMGSLYARGPVEKTPEGFASDVRNCKFISDSVRMRFALTSTATSIDVAARITGLANFVLTDAKFLMSFNSNGTLEREENEGEGNLAPIQSGIGTELYAEFDQAYQQMFMALSPLNAAGSVSPKSYYRYNGDYFLDDVGLAPNPSPATGSAIEGVGDVPIGTRYCIVLFETRSGYLSGATVDSVAQIVNGVFENQQLRINGIPLGPANTVKRWIAFTEAGASGAGPYYLIRENDTVFELNADITATVVPDNTTTTALFNFTDDALVAGDPVVTDDIDFFDKFKLPPQKSVYFSPSTKRLVWCGESDTIFRLSEPDDPETYFESTGFIQPGQKDGDFAIGAIEWRSELYLLKSNSAYVASYNNSHPNEWPAPRRWVGSGPAGPRAFDACEEFIAYASRSGLQLYEGGAPNTVTELIKDLWDQINWSYGHLIWVTIDKDEGEIHIGVPLGDSTLPNKRITANYTNGKSIYGIWQIRWSVDDIAAHQEVKVNRNLPASPNPQSPVGAMIRATQTLVATSEPTGTINMLDPYSINDNGNGIDQRWVSAYVAPKKLGIYTLGAVDIMASGTGQIQPYFSKLNNNAPIAMRVIPLTGYMTDHTRKPVKQGERFCFSVTNNGQPDSSFTLARITAYMKFMWLVRTI